jgi:hypothetical protein
VEIIKKFSQDNFVMPADHRFNPIQMDKELERINPDLRQEMYRTVDIQGNNFNEQEELISP